MVAGVRAEEAGAMTETPGQGGHSAGPAPEQPTPTEQAGGQAGGTPPPPPPTAAPPYGYERDGWNSENLRDYRRLRRSRDDRKIAGVAGGLGRHLDVDPTIIRVLLVVLVFFGGAGLLLYGAMWLLVPEDRTEEAVVRTSDSTRNALLIAVAVLAGLAAVGDSLDGYGFPWPLAVAALLVAVVLSTRDRGTRSNGAGPSYPPGPPVAPPPPGTPSAAGGGTSYPPPPPPGTPYGAGGSTGATTVLDPPAWYPPTPPPPPPAPRRRGPLLFGPTLALLAVTLGALGVYEAAGGSVVDAAYPAAAVAVVGAMLLVGAFYGRAGGLIALGIVGSLVLAGTAIGEPGFEGERDLYVVPQDAEALESRYDVPAGRVELDLRQIDADELDGRSLEVDVNAGEVLVRLPDDLEVNYDAAVEFGGEIVTPDGNRDGWGPSFSGVLQDDATPAMDLDIDVKFGRIEVRQ
jgi:phage shock protein PspC (stress-responsive transcriptional regulator)